MSESDRQESSFLKRWKWVLWGAAGLVTVLGGAIVGSRIFQKRRAKQRLSLLADALESFVPNSAKLSVLVEMRRDLYEEVESSFGNTVLLDALSESKEALLALWHVVVNRVSLLEKQSQEFSSVENDLFKLALGLIIMARDHNEASVQRILDDMIFTRVLTNHLLTEQDVSLLGETLFALEMPLKCSRKKDPFGCPAGSVPRNKFADAFVEADALDVLFRLLWSPQIVGAAGLLGHVLQDERHLLQIREKVVLDELIGRIRELDAEVPVPVSEGSRSSVSISDISLVDLLERKDELCLEITKLSSKRQVMLELIRNLLLTDPGLVSTFERVDDLVQFFLLALCTEDRRLAKLLLQILWVIKSETPPVHAQRIRGALLSPGNLPLLVEACVMFSDDVMCALPVLKWVAREGPSTLELVVAEIKKLPERDCVYDIDSLLEELFEEEVE